MSRLSLQIGPLHFIGIGGIGMSGIAEVMHNLGYKIQGSDAADSANVKRLRGQGIDVSIGHAAENLGKAAVVVYSSAVKADNPELSAARARQIPTVKRAEMLAELMRLKSAVAIAGTHGKTTTTTMVAALLEAGGFDPTVINGGIINKYGTNARLGQGDWMVVEADESDGTFVKLPATIAIVTNIDPEHLDHYRGFEGLKRAFDTFVENIPFYGFAVLCIDHPEVQSMIGRVSDRRLITYGYGPQADVRAVNVRFEGGVSHYDVLLSDRVKGGSRTLAGLTLPMPGEHNVQNSLSAIAVARELGVPDVTVREALAQFEGVKRRFTKTGVWNGVTVIDDYAHHPVEILSALKAARQVAMGRVIAVVQPHRYSRLKDLFKEFSTCMHGADTVVVSDVYPAGEQPMPGVSRDTLVESMRAHGHRNVIALQSPEELPKVISELARPGDYVVCLGAGSITIWANQLPGQLQALSESKR
ncbi:MAG: UDP-N-acetylmuramate--L-alanine ligase [Alphaproteobacteria bacterium]|nr:UDP-N-acetylmuramate--L-alanine ligase [Alphaproteobacteria bacterium]